MSATETLIAGQRIARETRGKPAVSRAPLSQGELFGIAIEHMAQGLLMLDADQRITVVNRTFNEIYGLSPLIIRVGATAYDLVEHSVLVGNYGETRWRQPGLRRASGWKPKPHGGSSSVWGTDASSTSPTRRSAQAVG